MVTKRVVLAEWHWIGHHPGFFAYFILALEELGAEILALCPQPEEACQAVAQLRKDWGLVAPNVPLTTYRHVAITRKRLHRRFARISAIDWNVRHFLAIEKIAKKWRTESGNQVDLVFYACVHEWDFDAFNFIAPFLSLPWAGLYLHALSIRMPGTKLHTGRIPYPERIFGGRLCRAVATFDEGITSKLTTVTGKPTIAFPDLTDDRLPLDAADRMLENRLRSLSAGRPLIGLFGYLLRSKGVYPFALLSRHPKMSGTCFAFAGEIAWNSFALDEAETIREILTTGSNTWNHLMRIPKEEQLNSLISSCDVLYAAYLDFSSSSNILAKVALFRKPVIVSEGHLMAERVRRFRMGEVVPQGDVEAQAEAVSKIIRDPRAWTEKSQPRWEDYAREHSFSRLKESFAELLLNI